MGLAKGDWVKNGIWGLGLLGWMVMASAACAEDRTQWTLRFPEAREYASALVGCYGTASYEYVVPRVDYLTGFQPELKKMAEANGIDGYAWSIQAGEEDPEDRKVVDLKTGKVMTLPQTEKAYVLCLCRETNLENCSRSKVPALGKPFFAEKKAAGENWIDPLTELEWSYASPGKNWKAGKALCKSQGARMPDLETLQVAFRRLRDSVVGKKLLMASELVWSATPGDDVVPQAFAVWVAHGDARWVMQSQPLPVACVKGEAKK